MSYSLTALVARREVLAPAVERLPQARAVELAGGFALLPLTEALLEQLDDAMPSGSAAPEEPLLGLVTAGLGRCAAELSEAGRVAFLDVDMWAGYGARASVVWEGGRVVAGPFRSCDCWTRSPGEPGDERTGNCQNAVSEALRALGVVRGHHHDEFDALGLGRHRQTERWLEDG